MRLVDRFPSCKTAHTATFRGVHYILTNIMGAAEQRRKPHEAEVCIVFWQGRT